MSNGIMIRLLNNTELRTVFHDTKNHVASVKTRHKSMTSVKSGFKAWLINSNLKKDLVENYGCMPGQIMTLTQIFAASLISLAY